MIRKITMSQLRKLLTSMKPTTSSAADHISMKIIKQARTQLEPQILNLINQIITTSTYPTQLKLAKVIPIPKKLKDKSLIDGWRPINLVPSISKLAEKTIMLQMMEHLNTNKLINTNHHGSVPKHSTQSLIIELHDKLVQYLENDEDIALVILDQSKAYDIVPHPILIEKLKILNYSEQSINTISSYLSERRQYVQIQNIESDILSVGPKSVTQGSTLSCLMYLIFIIDIPELFHEIKHKPIEYRACRKPNISTFVDDNFVIVKRQPNQTMQESVNQTMDKLKTYMDANKLALNKDKSKILIISKDKNMKENFQVNLDGKIVKHSKNVTILGTVMSDNLTWDHHLENKLIPNLKNRIRSLRQTTKYMDRNFKKHYVNAVFRGKALFGIETWSGAKKSNINSIQKLQETAAKIALKGQKGMEKMSKSQRQKSLKWLSIQEEAKYAIFRTVHNIINNQIPAELHQLMPINYTSPKLEIHSKLAVKPKHLNRTSLSTSTFRNQAYHYNTLPGRITFFKDPVKFKKMVKNTPHEPIKGT